MKILVTGSNGLLGQKIIKQLRDHEIDFLATSKGENRNPDCPEQFFCSLDITHEHEIETVFNAFKPTHIIHTAAITNVDYCELNPDECVLANTTAVSYLFKVSRAINAHFQLLSTDFVFDGTQGNYVETDPVGPLSVYAESKVNAEKILTDSVYQNWSIVRTIIVYGKAHNLSRSNIVLWAKDALVKGDPLSIVDDQFRAPTWADDLAWGCIAICRLNKTGIFHLSGPETMSIYTLVCRIAAHFNLSTQHIKPSKSSDIKQPAKRPPKTGFNLTKAEKELRYNPKKLEETLDLL